MKDWLNAYEERKRNAQLKEEKSAEKKRLMEDKLYDHFGYQISASSTKAKDYLRDLAEQEKKERKLQYKQDKQERERAQLKELLHKEAEAEKETKWINFADLIWTNSSFYWTHKTLKKGNVIVHLIATYNTNVITNTPSEEETQP